VSVRLIAAAIRHFEFALRFGRRPLSACSPRRRRWRGAVVDGRQREPRLDLVRADAFFLLFELVRARDLEQAVLLLRDAGEALAAPLRAAVRSASTRAANSPVLLGMELRAFCTRTQRFCASRSAWSRSFSVRRSFHTRALKDSARRQ
jgi:hypothetical protein